MKIFYTYTSNSSFVDKDEATFRKIGSVISNRFEVTDKWKTPIVFANQLLLLLTHFFTTKIYIAQFAGYHSFLPGIFSKLTGKPFVIISGGTDCVSYPSIRYGNFYKTVLGLFTKWSFQLATHLAPKHISLWHCDYTYEKNDPAKQGIKAFIPKLEKPVTPIANGYDTNFWQCNEPKKPKSFITVSGGFQYPFQVELKGIDLILEVAPLLPDCTFTIVGVPDWKVLPVKSANIILIPPTKNSELLPLYCKSQFYLQVSMAEGFPNALCEAMLCVCIPIVSNVFSMPEIIADSGFILKERDVNQLKSLIDQALEGDLIPLEKKARNQIANHYSIEKREIELTTLITNTVKK